MDISNSDFWAAVTLAGNESAAFRGKTEHLQALIVGFEIGALRHHFDLHRGTIALLSASPLRGAQVRISGPADEWQRVGRGEIPYGRAINVVHGRLRVEGDALAAAWATPALWELFHIVARVYLEVNQNV